jgi:hypothetical protein
LAHARDLRPGVRSKASPARAVHPGETGVQVVTASGL